MKGDSRHVPITLGAPRPGGAACWRGGRAAGRPRTTSATPGRWPNASTSYLAERWQRDKVTPAPLADDAEFLRRVYLDLAGTHPVGRRGARASSTTRPPDKRPRLIEELLDSPGLRQPLHQRLAHPAAAGERPQLLQLRYLQPGFELWLRKQFAGQRRLRQDGPPAADRCRSAPAATRCRPYQEMQNPNNADAARLLHGQGDQAGEPGGAHGAAVPRA